MRLNNDFLTLSITCVELFIVIFFQNQFIECMYIYTHYAPVSDHCFVLKGYLISFVVDYNPELYYGFS